MKRVDLYAGYTNGPLWANALAGYGALDNDITRDVQLGTYTDENTGKASGQSFALALRGGADFDLGAVVTGPVAGAVLQRIHIDGFTETGVSGTTALSFGSQRRDSAVTQLGWRAALSWGVLQPFAEAQWNHEWSGKDRRVTASLTTVSAAPYGMDAAPIASDWATISGGATLRLTSRMTLTGTISSAVGNSVVKNTGGGLRLVLGL